MEAVLDPPMKDARFHLQAATGLEAVSAFWFVQTTTDDRKANMVWAKFLISGYFGQDFIGQEPLQIDTPESSMPSPEQPGGGEEASLPDDGQGSAAGGRQGHGSGEQRSGGGG